MNIKKRNVETESCAVEEEIEKRMLPSMVERKVLRFLDFFLSLFMLFILFSFFYPV